MSDYKRFVAYLYEYHEQQKGENRGFVRVEVRNGTCQMAFQIKVYSLPEGSALNVYGFVRIKNFLYGIRPERNYRTADDAFRTYGRFHFFLK